MVSPTEIFLINFLISILRVQASASIVCIKRRSAGTLATRLQSISGSTAAVSVGAHPTMKVVATLCETYLHLQHPRPDVFGDFTFRAQRNDEGFLNGKVAFERSGLASVTIAVNTGMNDSLRRIF